jgi:pyruvate/2-oxoacid:ferredoxin oxidoreductase beta subunit
MLIKYPADIPAPAVMQSPFNQQAAVQTGIRLLSEAWTIESGLSLKQPTRDHLIAVMDWCRDLVQAAAGDGAKVEELMRTMEGLAVRNAALENGWLDYAIRQGITDEL